MALRIVLEVDSDNYKTTHEMMQAVIRFLDDAVDGGYVYSHPDEDSEDIAIRHAELHVTRGERIVGQLPLGSKPFSEALAEEVAAIKRSFNPDDNTTGE